MGGLTAGAGGSKSEPSAHLVRAGMGSGMLLRRGGQRGAHRIRMPTPEGVPNPLSHSVHMSEIYGDFVTTETRGGVRKGAGEVGEYFTDFP